MALLKDLTVEEFAAKTASNAPTPGGGSVASLVGALGAGLSVMLADLTIGNEKYLEVQDRMKEISEEGNALVADLIDGIRRDSTSFSGYMAALKLPKSTDEEKEIRRAAMQQGLKDATEGPMGIAESAAKIFPLAYDAVKYGNAAAVTDGLVSAMLARTCVITALFNAKINLKSIKDEAYKEEKSARVAELEKLAIAEEKRILELSEYSQGILD